MFCIKSEDISYFSYAFAVFIFADKFDPAVGLIVGINISAFDFDLEPRCRRTV